MYTRVSDSNRNSWRSNIEYYSIKYSNSSNISNSLNTGKFHVKKPIIFTNFSIFQGWVNQLLQQVCPSGHVFEIIMDINLLLLRYFNWDKNVCFVNFNCVANVRYFINLTKEIACLRLKMFIFGIRFCNQIVRVIG